MRRLHRRHAPSCAAGVGDTRVRVLDYAENQGKGIAISHGLDARARAPGRLAGPRPRHRPRRRSSRRARRFERGRVDAVIGTKRHPGSRGRLPAAAARLLVGLPAARPRAVPRQRPRHAGRREALPARDARHRRAAAARSSATPSTSRCWPSAPSSASTASRRCRSQLDYRFTGTAINWRGGASHVRGHARDRLPDPPAPLVRAPLRGAPARAHRCPARRGDDL